MICSKVCMFCESSKEAFINYSRYHGVCYNHSQTYERLYKCIHCSSIVPILPQVCAKCLSSNIFPVISSDIPICFACNAVPAPSSFQCTNCLQYEDVYKAPRCDHLVCFECFNQNFERCPICEILNCELCCQKIDKLEIECGHLACNKCFYNNHNKCPLCPSDIFQDLNKEACNKCNCLFEKPYELPSEIKVCENCFKNSEKEEIELKNKEIDFSFNESDVSVTFKVDEDIRIIEPHSQISDNSEILLSTSKKSLEKNRKVADSEANYMKSQWVNTETIITSVEINELSPPVNPKHKGNKNCTSLTIFFLLIIFYLSTLCFCFSCFFNCFQGFNTKKKSSKILYLLCLCKSGYLTRTLWTNIVKCKYFSNNKNS